MNAYTGHIGHVVRPGPTEQQRHEKISLLVAFIVHAQTIADSKEINS